MALEVPCVPSRMLRFADNVVELLSSGETVRIPVADLGSVATWPPKRGRVKVQLRYQSGIGGASQSFWVGESDRDAVDDLARVAVDARNALRAGTPAADGAAGLSEELARLGELHQSGQLSDDEFAAAKSKLLSS